MLHVTQATNGTATQNYFETTLTQGDYYLGQEVAAHWHGHGADLLGVGKGSAVTHEQFSLLLRGYHPVTRAKLTQRLRKDRRPGMDLTFSVPKSVSLAWAFGEDERLLEVLQEVVNETMARDVEPLMARRVRKGKFASTKQQQATGKLIYADFLHKTSRPVDGKPDPQLHVHAFVMNWTEEEGKHYAGEFEEIKRQAPCLQAKFHARLAKRLEELGYGVEHTRYRQSGTLKTGWEIAGVERATIEKFSNRTEQIEAYAEKHGVTDAEDKGKLGVLTRDQKDKSLSVQELRSEWDSRLTPAERETFANLLDRNTSGQGEEGAFTQIWVNAAEATRAVPTERQAEAEHRPASAPTPPAEPTPAEVDRAIESVQYALDHHLYRQSTVERHQVVGTALVHGLNIGPEAVEKALDSLALIEGTAEVNGSVRRLVTTRSVLEAERRMIGYARDGRGTRKAIRNADHVFARTWLNDHQRSAVEHVLKSRDAVVAVVGGAGTGKTSMMQEAVEAIHLNGKQVFTFAPSTGAREVLQDKGFDSAETVEHLIRNTKLHPKVRDQVIWIDEAGLLDVRSMNAVFDIAREQNARIVLSGDTRQHASPRRGEAMRLLENEAGLKLARSEKIQRQKGQYAQAVGLISRGNEIVDRQGRTGLVAGFDRLDAMGKIVELPREERHARLAADYMAAVDRGTSTLIVAPTHAEKQAVTHEIRTQLQDQGKLSAAEREVTQYRSLNLTEAEKGNPRTYEHLVDRVIQLHQHTKGGFKRGERYRIAGVEGESVRVTSLDGKQAKHMPLDRPERFEVYEESTISLAPGDRVRFSLGGTTKNGKSRISNGRLDTVKGFDRRGNLVLTNGWTIDRDYAHLDLGYVITSHAAQGKDRDLAIAAMGSQSLPAINARQFYVTASRGKEDVAIYVDDKQAVREAIQNSGQQLSASDLAKSGGAIGKELAVDRGRVMKHSIRAMQDRMRQWWRAREREPARQHQSSLNRPAAVKRARGPESRPNPGREL